eukprot:807085-Prymnesium_polylepis.1
MPSSPRPTLHTPHQPSSPRRMRTQPLLSSDHTDRGWETDTAMRCATSGPGGFELCYAKAGMSLFKPGQGPPVLSLHERLLSLLLRQQVGRGDVVLANAG